jgi:hypothetical protein
MVMMRCLDSDSTAHDSIMKLLKLGGFLANTGLDRW